MLKVRRESDGCEFAMKYCHLADPMGKARFGREVRILAKLTHKHIVPVVDVSLETTPPFFIMPLASGTLESEIDVLKTSETMAIDAFKQMCFGVEAMHSDSVHRDINPRNALRMPDGNVCVSDLGLAKHQSRETTILTDTMMIVGTQGYIAPEQQLPAGTRDADVRTDIYQLGKTLYHLLTGLPPVLVDASALPSGLGHIVKKATKEDPKERYQTVGELLDAINSYEAAKDPDANPKIHIENALDRIEERITKREYREDEVRVLLSMLVSPKMNDDDLLLSFFDRIPTLILQVLPKQFSAEFAPVLDKYVTAIDATVGGRSFSYAEEVADKMAVVFSAEGAVPEIRARALEAVLIAAVKLNRFAAMSKFDELLKSVQDDADAFAVADMLRRQAKYYGTRASSLPSVTLHPTVRAVQDEVTRGE